MSLFKHQKKKKTDAKETYGQKSKPQTDKKETPTSEQQNRKSL